MIRKVPFLDLRITSETEKSELLEAVDTVFQHGRLVMGPEVAQLEETIANRIGKKYAVGVASGTDALYLALRSLDIGPGDEVITTALSWIATANAVALTGATPVFVDIDDDLNLAPDAVRQAITDKTRAILPVHYTGKICDMDELILIARENGLYLVEDASQAFDATYKGKKAGSFGDVACFSLNPMKVFAACGEAGIVLTDREEICERLHMLRYNGTVNKEVCLHTALNGRLDTLQAAILLKRLPLVANIIRKRREIAHRYRDRLSPYVGIPVEAPGSGDIYYTYTIKADKRDQLKTFLENEGIETKIHHPILMPHQPAYRSLRSGEWPNAGRLVKRILSIPVHEKLSSHDADYVADMIEAFYKES